MPLARMLRYGMVGGGPNAFIGAVHRRAATMDGLAVLAAGAFSADGAKSRAMGEVLHLDGGRVYRTYEEMADREAALPESERIDFVTIATPNHLHFPVARAFIDRGFHIICDKPLTTTLDDAEAICRLVDARGVIFALTHNYTGYPLVKQARALIADGMLGRLRKVVVEYSQGWLATRLEETGQKQAVWRTDPHRAGVSSAVADIGTHAENLARYVTGLELDRLCADVTTFVDGRVLEDDAAVLIRYKGGAHGVLSCSQVAVGEENNLRLRVYGSDASLEWRQEDPNSLSIRRANAPEEVHKRGNAYLGAAAQHATRLPPGHPEAFLEAFANVYGNAMRTIASRLAQEVPNALDLDFPTARDGAMGVHFIHTVIRSGRVGGWVDANYSPPGSRSPFV
ncbi:MAG: Gfo/Idh/MocA family oxidoreductase [Gemmatimonadaceae bacterium]